MNSEGKNCGQQGEAHELSLADRWIISRLQQVEDQVNRSMATYRFDHIAQELYGFIWLEFCSWYLELAKVTLNNSTLQEVHHLGTRRTLVRVLETLLRLLHPLMPFITEEIWQKIAPLAGVTGDSIMLRPFPQTEDAKIDQPSLDDMSWIQAVITGVRNIRGEMNISPGKILPVLLQQVEDKDIERLQQSRQYLLAVGRIESIEVLGKNDQAPEAASSLVGHMLVLVPLGDLIDKREELQRLAREEVKKQKELDVVDRKLANANFVDKAPPAVVDKERQRLKTLHQTLEDLHKQIAKVEKL